MPSKKQKITVFVTLEEHEWFQRHGRISATIRHALVTVHPDFPNNMPEPGEHNRKEPENKKGERD